MSAVSILVPLRPQLLEFWAVELGGPIRNRKRHSLNGNVLTILFHLKVSATQYALCLDGGLCSAYCQTKERKAAGVCAGPTNWDCYCEDADGNREAGKQALYRASVQDATWEIKGSKQQLF